MTVERRANTPSKTQSTQSESKARKKKMQRMSLARTNSRTAQGNASRERILEAAAELISERGYSATSVDALCRKAGIVKTALYWHFGSKEGLLACVLDRVARAWIDDLLECANAPGTPRARLDRILHYMQLSVEKRASLTRLLLAALVEQAELNPDAQKVLRKTVLCARTALLDAVEIAVGCSLPNRELKIDIALSLLNGACVKQLVVGETADLKGIFDFLRSTLLEGIEI